MIGRAGAIDDAIQILRRESGFLERLARRFARECDAGIAAIHPVARLDPAALLNPFVGRIHHRREIVVRHDARGNVEASRK